MRMYVENMIILILRRLNILIYGCCEGNIIQTEIIHILLKYKDLFLFAILTLKPKTSLEYKLFNWIDKREGALQSQARAEIELRGNCSVISL